MLKYIIRLDDACPYMNKEKWDRIEQLLDKYNVKPIVGIIPDSKDAEFNHKYIENFWEKYGVRWQNKGWIIAQHGLHHNLNKIIRTEFKNRPYGEQVEVLKKGQEILLKNKLQANCFFAPAHTFDANTVKACCDLKFFSFISDGYAFYPYEYCGVMFLPSVFDTPHKISNFGVFTFVYHPNNMSDKDFEYLERFLTINKKEFEVDILELIKKFKGRKRNLLDYMLWFAITTYRTFRRILKGE